MFVGLLTSCGPFNTGGPANDAGENLGLHGPHSNTGAEIESVIQPRPHEGELDMSITGSVKYGRFFGPCVELRRTIKSTLGSNKIAITDEFYNAGNQDVPHAWLLHINLGYPLVDAGAELCFDETKVEPVNTELSQKHFAKGNNYKKIPAPLELHRGGKEFVAYVYPRSKSGKTTVGIINTKLNIGLAIRYDTRQFPRCGNWQHFGPHEYVTALEPMNGGVEGRDKDRAKGWLDNIPAGGKKKYQYEIEVVTDKEGLAELEKLNGK